MEAARNIKILCLLICFVFLLPTTAQSYTQENAKIAAHGNFGKLVSVDNTNQNFKPIAKKGFPNIFRPIGNFVKRLFGRKSPVCILRNTVPVINNVNLTKNEIFLKCPFDTQQLGSCAKSPPSIAVTADATDAENDPLVYQYKVSGGKIIGYGSNVIWNLADVMPGIYTIEVCVDDGNGCIKSIVKEVRVSECPDCDPPPLPPIY